MRSGPILLVDDEPVVLQIHAAAVQHFGFETIIASSAEEATNYTRSYRPSLIISDVQMPGEGGFDFVEGLERSGLKNMPVIFLTGYDDIDIVRGGLRAGGDDFIIKGGSVDRIRHRLAFWMTSGFNELPSDVRQRARSAANQVIGDQFKSVENHMRVDAEITQRITARLHEELQQLPNDYGTRLVERVCFLGRLSKIVIEEGQSFGHLIRFPDYLTLVIKALDPPWGQEVWPLFQRFDDWSCDTRFVLAGVEPLKPFVEYDWYADGLDT
jgi:DNA-binding response OmpR family regulator